MEKRYRIFGQNLHYLIRSSGHSMMGFCRRHDLAYSLLKRYTSGQVAPRPERLKLFAEDLGVSPGSLMWDDLVPDIMELK